MVEREQARGRRAGSRSPGSSSSTRGRPRRSTTYIAALPEPQGGPLGAGRAAQHGPVAALRAQRRGRRSTLHVEPVTRPASSSPSVGTVKRHMEEQKALLDRAFAPWTTAPATTTDVLHRPRDRGAARSAGVTRRSPWPGSPSGCRSSPTSTPSSRPPSSGSPPGWPGSTTPRTEHDECRHAATRPTRTPDRRTPLRRGPMQGQLWVSPVPAARRRRRAAGRPACTAPRSSATSRAATLTYSELLVARPVKSADHGRRVEHHRHLGRLPRVGRGRSRALGDPEGPVRLHPRDRPHRPAVAHRRGRPRCDRRPIASASFTDVSRAAPRLPFKGGTWQPGIDDTDGAGADGRPARLVEDPALPGPLGVRVRRAARLAGRRAAARVVPDGGLPDVVRLSRGQAIACRCSAVGGRTNVPG